MDSPNKFPPFMCLATLIMTVAIRAGQLDKVASKLGKPETLVTVSDVLKYMAKNPYHKVHWSEPQRPLFA